MDEATVRSKLYGSNVNGFQKFDESKPRFSLLPAEQLASVVAVFEFGAKKYGADNWKDCQEPMRYWDAALRHLWAHRLRKANDPETGRSHLAHATACLLILAALEESVQKEVPPL